ncbi:hypothetical protein BGZ65_006524, partial [Modicella reniformis]
MAQVEHDERTTGINPSDTIVNLDDSAGSKETNGRKRNLDTLRKSLRPVMLYVVSTAQFLDI